MLAAWHLKKTSIHHKACIFLVRRGITLGTLIILGKFRENMEHIVIIDTKRKLELKQKERGEQEPWKLETEPLSYLCSTYTYASPGGMWAAK